MANRFEPNKEHTCGIFRAKRNSKCSECKTMLKKGEWGAMWDGKAVHFSCHKKAQTSVILSKKHIKKTNPQQGFFII